MPRRYDSGLWVASVSGKAGLRILADAWAQRPPWIVFRSDVPAALRIAERRYRLDAGWREPSGQVRYYATRIPRSEYV